MLIYFVRHGQTDWNKELRWQGRSDIELNKTGRAQAKAVQAHFLAQSIRPSAVVSSPMKRALETARSIANAFKQDVVQEQAFSEIDLGEFEGKISDELKAEYGEHYDCWRANHHLQAPPGGENLEQAIGRMQAPLNAHIQHYGDQLVIVAHQAILMAMKAALSGDRSLEGLSSYKQANFEIDAWDVEHAQIAKRIEIRS